MVHELKILFSGFEEFNREPNDDYFGSIEKDPVTSIQVEALEQLKPSSPNPRYEQAPTSPVTFADVNLRGNLIKV